ncbi:50S ribosomal protein L9 [Candidatus Kaiserbacteria bacterium]|nr:50S ribosomal protein L9 [Candidatus Kaiserbacteria bacterium]
MKVILLSDVRGSGKKYDIKDVSDGYAMNFLLPNKLADRATPKRVKEIERMRQEMSEETRIQENLLEKNFDALKRIRLEMSEKANEKGVLFKGITPDILSKELKKQVRVELPASAIVLEKPIKEIGEYTVLVVVGEHKTSFTLVVSGTK